MASPEMQQLKAMYKTGSLSMDEFLFMSKDLQQTSLAEEEEEASAHDGQSSSHASHDGGAYGNSTGSIAHNSGARAHAPNPTPTLRHLQHPGTPVRKCFQESNISRGVALFSLAQAKYCPLPPRTILSPPAP